MTLDGVMQAPGAPDEDRTGGFDHGGWAFGYLDDEFMEMVQAAFSKPFDLVLGRKTYDIFAGYWPRQEGPIADGLNRARKYVASRTLKELDWENSELLQGDAAEALGRVKQKDGPELITQGSTELLQTLLAAGLVDEFRLMTFPVIAGSGKRLFGSGAQPAGLRLLDTTTTPSGVVVTAYGLEGPIRRGSIPTGEAAEA
jgi:dihydrofolate reductase